MRDRQTDVQTVINLCQVDGVVCREVKAVKAGYRRSNPDAESC